MKWPYKGLISAVSIALLLTACGANGREKDKWHSANGDLHEKTASASELPSFLRAKPRELRLVYQAAGQAGDLLKWIPCYCGCAESAGHASNLNCFLDQVNEDGSVVWDDHGTRCDVCVKTAAESIGMRQQGKTPSEIRAYIDRKYASGYAKPTETPMPQ